MFFSKLQTRGVILRYIYRYRQDCLPVYIVIIVSNVILILIFIIVIIINIINMFFSIIVRLAIRPYPE